MTPDVSNGVLQDYPIGEIIEVSPIASGLIHETHKIATADGRYVLQKLHPKLATDAIATDFANVTDYLKEQGFPAPRLVRTNEGEVLAEDEGGGRWRMQTYLEGETHDVAKAPEMVASAAGMYARFHRVMEDFPHTFASQRSSHNTRTIHKDFVSTVEQYRGNEIFEPVSHICEVVESDLPDLFLPEDLPERVIHGDPKISNVRFRGGEAAALLDLDTCTRQTVLVELGDAFRSWCSRQEDDPNNSFNAEYFSAGWSGYIDESDGFLTQRERQLVPQAIATITLELAARFLRDYFEDTYFGWDNDAYSSRREHNLARSKGQIALYLDIKNKMAPLQKIVNTVNA